MADEEDPWGFDDSADTKEEAPAPAPAASATPAAASIAGSIHGSTHGSIHGSVAGDSAANIDGAPIEQETAAAPPPPPEDDGYRKPVQLYRHWVRPQFLQYRYMYNYRTNYYDDVIDYLDKKQVGVSRDIPRPQTWAERVLRTNNAHGRCLDYTPMTKKEKLLTQTLAAAIRPYNYHTKAYINQKYANVL